MWARHTEAVRSQSGARPFTVLEDEGSSEAVGRSSQPSATGGSGQDRAKGNFQPETGRHRPKDDTVGSTVPVDIASLSMNSTPTYVGYFFWLLVPVLFFGYCNGHLKYQGNYPPGMLRFNIEPTGTGKTKARSQVDTIKFVSLSCSARGSRHLKNLPEAVGVTSLVASVSVRFELPPERMKVGNEKKFYVGSCELGRWNRSPQTCN
ncbi:hypothetical protein RUM43_014490 [Polyplax serrata]|uniref:Uncharacterized protein n=1 Tax=Polyplax serrata TaxID=468196 RepID=A0AAN8P1I7_POLSC